MRKRRNVVMALTALVLIGLLAFVYPWQAIRGGGASDLTLTFSVADSASGKPVMDVHIAQYTDTGTVVKVLRTDMSGAASIVTECTVAEGMDRNPLTGLVWRSYRIAFVPGWHVVATANGYQPPEPWWLPDRCHGAAAEQGDAFVLDIPIRLTPQSSPP
jgi:hypothetical protein